MFLNFKILNKILFGDSNLLHDSLFTCQIYMYTVHLINTKKIHSSLKIHIQFFQIVICMKRSCHL